MRTFIRAFIALVSISFAMVVVQWLAAPEGYGANGWAHALPQLGHPKLGKMLLWLSESRSLHIVNGVGENFINAPRNELLRIFHIDAIGSYGSTFEYGEFNPPATVGDGLLIKLFVGFVTVLIYLPMTIGIALIQRSGWKVMKEPVLISSLLFVIVAIGFLAVSKSDEQSKLAVIFTALSLLTAAVGILWSPLLSRRSRFAALASLLIICSIVGMFAVTKGSGPRDAPSYPVFFGWSLMMLVLEGGSFLLLVWLLLRMMERLRGDAPPPPMELKTAK
jgi:hypothetical protein